MNTIINILELFLLRLKRRGETERRMPKKLFIILLLKDQIYHYLSQIEAADVEISNQINFQGVPCCAWSS